MTRFRVAPESQPRNLEKSASRSMLRHGEGVSRAMAARRLLHIDIDTEDSTMTVAIRGALTFSQDVVLREAIFEVLEASPRRAVLDLSGVDQIDSSGIGELVAAYTTLRNRKIECDLRGLSAKVADVLKITGLDKILGGLDGEPEAVHATLQH